MVDFGVHPLPPATIGDFVWSDLNANGVQDAGEPGIGDAQVCAQPMGHLAVRCATTNRAGVYRLCLERGAYLVVPGAVPEGMIPSTPDFKLPQVVITGGQYADVNFGYRSAQP